MQTVVTPYFLKLNSRKKNTMIMAMLMPAKICGSASLPYSISPPTSQRTPSGNSISSVMISAIRCSTGLV